ncbi:MAG: phosphoribosylformylglycinamidine synthase subunit PurQ, partial [Clostridia bacterium]|nr:phosphoribosylformylglycinamidine synthase subunit PurQ [Clostridia bacterium]
LCGEGKVKAAWAVENGLGEAVMKMSFGNEIGFKATAKLNPADWHLPFYGFIVAELTEDVTLRGTLKLGVTTAEPVIELGKDKATIAELLSLNEATLEGVYPTTAPATGELPVFAYNGGSTAAPAVKCARPKALIPVFPGTNCEYDSAKALERAGADPEIVVIRNLTADDVARSVETVASKLAQSNMVFIPGGFSGGDEPDGSAKFITAFFRNPAIKAQVHDLLDNRDGLMLGICNGFQALIKLGLVPFGKIIDTDETCPTLTYNIIGRHQSKLVRTRVCTNKSPWLAGTNVGDIYTVPISHGEGRFLCSDELVRKLAENGQIATQYVDLSGNPSMDTAFNPNGSVCAIEGITSPDGRVLGKMGHSERIGKNLYRNVIGEYDMKLFESAVKYFKG